MRILARTFKSTTATLEATRPVEIQFRRDEDLFFAESEVLGIYAAGESIKAAFREFIDQVVYFFKYYRSLAAEEVTADAVRLRRLYLEEFREVPSPTPS